MNEEITQLNNKIRELEGKLESFASVIAGLTEWKKKKETQQISAPLDDASQTIIDRRRIRTGVTDTFTNGDGDTVTVTKGIITKIA